MRKAKGLLAGLLAMALLLAGLPMYGMEAKAAQSGDYEYEVNEYGILVITKYAGSGGEVVIPSELDGKKVMKIGDSAFKGCIGLTSVEIPSSVTEISDSAFSGCIGLTSVEIPSSVRWILDSAFKGCSSLTNVEIPSSVREIGANAFEGCIGLTSVEIPSSVKKIDWSVFEGCVGLTNVVILSSVASIGPSAFKGCSSLTSMEIPSSVASIGDSAFSGCIGLTSMEIPSSVTYIGYSVVYGCSGLESLKVLEGNAKYDSRENCNGIIETASNTLVAGCKNTKIPSSVTSIGDSAFSGCIGLTSMEIPSSVTGIGNYAFSGCSSLTNVEIPGSMARIGVSAFNGSNLTSVEIPSSVTEIGTGAFRGCSSLESLKVLEGNEKYNSRENCNGIIETASNTLVAGCKNTKIPSSVAIIGFSAFEGCSGLTSVAIPSSVTGISDYAFKGCSGLTSVAIPSSVKWILDSAFSGCSSLTSVVIPPSVTGITYNAFLGCSENLVIVGVPGSEAEEYAQRNSITFKFLDSVQDISEASITLERASYTYDGKPKTPAVTVKLGGKTLAPNTDYTVSYSDNINVGTAKAAVTGKGGYTGSKSAAFAIVEAPGTGQPAPAITCKKTLYKVTYGAKPFKVKATSASRLSFTSNKPKVAAVAKDTGEVTVKGTGVAEITVKAGKESVKVTVQVSPRRPSLKSAKAAKGRKLTVKWVKDRMAAGYQVQVSTSKAFKKDVKSKKLAKASHTFTKLKAGKKYYVRVRSYKGALRSAWSKVRQSGKIKR